MSVLLSDAVEFIGDAAKLAYKKMDLADLLYADDTLLLGVNDQHVAEYLKTVQDAGNRYGMELHAKKFQLLSTDSTAQV